MPATLATVNSSPGSCGDATHTCDVTVNAKGLTTAQTPVAITFPSGLSYTSPALNAIPKVGNATAPGTLVNSSLSDSGTVVSTAEQVNLGTLNVANSAVVIASQSGGSGYSFCTVNLSGGTCSTAPTFECIGVGSVPQQALVFPTNAGGSCSASPTATISGPGGSSGVRSRLRLRPRSLLLHPARGPSLRPSRTAAVPWSEASRRPSISRAFESCDRRERIDPLFGSLD